MKKPIPLFAASLYALCCCLLSCGKGTPQTAESPTLHISREDEALNQIGREARESFPDFILKMRNPEPDEGGFRVKYPFETEGGSAFSHEHVWLENIFFEDGLYYGTLANRPYYLGSLQAGDVVVFEGGAISDWMYVKAGRIAGGRSIKYLIEQIPEPDRDDESRALYRMFASD
jgi:uncharacterized protein YegJ (DUF2314 family)